MGAAVYEKYGPCGPNPFYFLQILKSKGPKEEDEWVDVDVHEELKSHDHELSYVSVEEKAFEGLALANVTTNDGTFGGRGFHVERQAGDLNPAELEKQVEELIKNDAWRQPQGTFKIREDRY
jgi:hypothetical protein